MVSLRSEKNLQQSPWCFSISNFSPVCLGPSLSRALNRKCIQKSIVFDSEQGICLTDVSPQEGPDPSTGLAASKTHIPDGACMHEAWTHWGLVGKGMKNHSGVCWRLKQIKARPTGWMGHVRILRNDGLCSWFILGRVFFAFKLPCCRHQTAFSEVDFQTRRCFSWVVGSADTDPGAPSL